ncbi:MAG TPA: RICIN domain-containing protein, partial [Actinoplanes sp.]|nr:RICIN domain-containing protein [Actinoplanes sp.]
SDGGDDIPDVPGAPVPDRETPAAGVTSPAPSSAAPSPSGAVSPAPDPSGSTGPDPVLPLPSIPEGILPSVALTPVARYNATSGTGDQEENASPDVPPALTDDGVQAVLEIREQTSGSVRLTWSAAGADADYEVSVDGEPVASTKATRARLIGLKPDAKYLVEVRNRKLGYRAKGNAETAPAARPVQNSWFVLTNSLTGGAADLYAARSADGTPITLGNDEGGTQQQWQLVPAGDDTYSLVSKASNRCAVPLGGEAVAGAPLVQGDCRSGAAARWTLRASAYGFTIRATSGDLVIGAGAQRFGTYRVLVLQKDTEQRHQSWTAVPD